MSFPSHSPQPQALSPSETGRKLPLASNHLVTEPTTTTEAPGRDQALLVLPTRPQRFRTCSNLVSILRSTSFFPGDLPGHPLKDDPTATLGSRPRG